ncbi:MAG: AlpA family transcriptional regulator [Bacteroidetes bacterium]|nr:AlpA family transcriptional regulator [Bacteroidota bacterium]
MISFHPIVSAIANSVHDHCKSEISVAANKVKSESQEHFTAPNLISIKQVQVRCTLSRSTIYAYIKKGIFPRPYLIGARAVRFSESEIDQWINGRIKNQTND